MSVAIKMAVLVVIIQKKKKSQNKDGNTRQTKEKKREEGRAHWRRRRCRERGLILHWWWFIKVVGSDSSIMEWICISFETGVNIFSFGYIWFFFIRKIQLNRNLSYIIKTNQKLVWFCFVPSYLHSVASSVSVFNSFS